MNIVSPANCSSWLSERNIPEAPYRSQRPFDQFPLPREAWRVAVVIRELMAVVGPFNFALLQFTDWPLYKPDEMAVIVALRSAHGEKGWLIQTPGHIFSSEEADLMSGMFSLAAFYDWSAYLYFDHHTVFHCWEGELLDLWVPDPKRLQEIREVFARHSISPTPPPKTPV